MALHTYNNIQQSAWTILEDRPSLGNGPRVLVRCTCGTERVTLRRNVEKGISRSCGCQRRTAPEDRFWSFAQKADPATCWEWGSVRNHSGYGKFWLNGRTDLAHRVSYLINVGPIADGLMVRHTCDNPPCVNPSHLLLGTGKDNAADALERDRYRRGTGNPRAKLTEDQVLEIRRRRSEGETQKSIALSLGISRSNVQWIEHGRNWAHVGGAA